MKQEANDDEKEFNALVEGSKISSKEEKSVYIQVFKSLISQQQQQQTNNSSSIQDSNDNNEIPSSLDILTKVVLHSTDKKAKLEEVRYLAGNIRFY